MSFFNDAFRKDPFPAYKILRQLAHLQHLEPPWDAYLVSRYDDVRRVLSDHVNFSSQMVPAPPHWSPIFSDPPKHTRHRGILANFFTPKHVANLEPMIRRIAEELFGHIDPKNVVEFAQEFAIPFPLKVICRLLGIPDDDWLLFRAWAEAMSGLSLGKAGGSEAQLAFERFTAANFEMLGYLYAVVPERLERPQGGLLDWLLKPDAGLTGPDILGMIQVLLTAGSDTFSNFLNNAMITLAQNPDHLDFLHDDLGLLPVAIEELFRFRSPLQWMPRVTRAPVELNGTLLPAGKLILAMIGSANHDPAHFDQPDVLDLVRHPNSHLAFGCGIHSCLGAALARLEARVALEGILLRWRRWEMIGDWAPRPALHVLGPVELFLRVTT